MKRLNEIFDIRYGHSLELNRLNRESTENGFPFVSRKMGDNGVAAYVQKVSGIEPYPAGELTCALSGSGILSTFVQERPYYTAFHVACLRPIAEMTTTEKLYYCICIRSNRYRYGWGRQANRSLKDIMIPEKCDIPKWVADVSLDRFEGVDAPLVDRQSPTFDVATWGRFQLASLFEIKKGKRLTKANMSPGKTVFIGAVDNNNGLTAFVAQPALHPSKTMTVNYNGNGVAEAFYQPVPYRCSDDVNVLYPRFELTPAIALFVAAVIRQEKYRFSYGRKWHLERMAQAEIRLPAQKDGTPDWTWIENYINTLPFSSQI